MTGTDPLRGAPLPRARLLLGAAAAVLAAIPVALLVAAIHDHNPGNPERAVARTVMVFVALLLAGPAGVLAVRRKETTPGDAGLAVLIGASILLAGSYLYWASPAILLRADTIIWSEGLFTGDIVKIRAGYPLFTAPANLESTFYPPGASMLTYALATLAGHATSVPAYRVIQLLYAGIAALFGALAAQRILSLARPGRAPVHPAAWGALWGSLFLLCATNSLTNPFAHLLHNDALGVLVSSFAFFLLVEYAAERKVRTLILLALVPAAGFYVKQSLLIWAPLVSGYLLVFDRPRSTRRVFAYGFAAFGIAALAFGAGRLAWGTDFQFWVIDDLRGHPFSVLRSVQHAVTAWAYFAAGIVAALILFGREWRALAGLWGVWLLLLGQEAYTSGIAWMLNHLGPGSLIAGVWMGAALAAAWPRTPARPGKAGLTWMRAALATATLLFFYSGLGLVRIPVPGLPPDLDRYVAAIEAEFTGMDPRQVLLDQGTWVYLPSGTVPQDRSALVGDLGSSGLGDFSGILGRINGKAYRRILMHSYRAPEFGYDYYMWPRSSGIRAALAANYREVRRIPAVQGEEDGTPYLREISVLEPLP